MGRIAEKLFKILLGESGVRALQDGNIETLLKKMTHEGSLMGMQEAFDIAHLYIEAMRQQGFDMDDSEQSLLNEEAQTLNHKLTL